MTSLDGIAHIIQIALTPIFLLSGVATLLNVFSTRLGRVSDRVDHLAGLECASDPHAMAQRDLQLAFLRRRSSILDVAVVLAAIAGIGTCAAALTLLIGALRARTSPWVLFSVFGVAVLFTVGALCAFVYEMLLASRGVRAAAARASDRTPAGPAPPA